MCIFGGSRVALHSHPDALPYHVVTSNSRASCFWVVLSLFTVSGGEPLSEIAGPFSAADVAADCSGGVLKEPILWVISYALVAVCALVLIGLLLLLLLPCRRGDRGEITDESSLVRHRIK